MPPLFVFIIGSLCGAIGIVFAAGVWNIVTAPISARSSKRSPIVLRQVSGSLGNVLRESPSPSYGLGSSAARAETPHSALVDAPQRRAATEVPAPSFVRAFASSCHDNGAGVCVSCSTVHTMPRLTFSFSAQEICGDRLRPGAQHCTKPRGHRGLHWHQTDGKTSEAWS